MSAAIYNEVLQFFVIIAALLPLTLIGLHRVGGWSGLEEKITSFAAEHPDVTPAAEQLNSWPGQARTLFGDHERFEQTYFSTFRGMYFTGDGARRDTDGYYWITGRVDDVINVAGHRMGTAEV